MSEEERDITNEELRDRVVYALMGPTARFARVFGIPLSQMRDWLDMAYYHETKRHNFKMKEVAALMQVSMSKVALLSRQLKGNFLRDDLTNALPRRIEFMLWAQPLSLAKIRQVITDASAKEVNDAIQELMEEGRIAKIGDPTQPLYELQIATDRRVWDNWLARVDGLNNVLHNVSDAIYARFFTDGSTSFARTLTFRVREEDMDELKAFYEEQLFELIQRLDEAAEDEDALPISLSLFWAPHDLLNKLKQQQEDSE